MSSSDAGDSYRQTQLDAVQNALRMTFNRVSSLPPPQVVPYLSNMVQIGIELLRAGGAEDAYVRGFLTAALDSLQAPPTLAMKDLRVN